jgi:hypothetical protein
MKQRKRPDHSSANSLQAAPGASAPQPALSSIASPAIAPPPPPTPAAPPPTIAKPSPSRFQLTLIDPPPTAAEWYSFHVGGEIESNRFVFGGLLTITGSLQPAAIHSLRANGNPVVKLDPREFTFLLALIWHSFKKARIPVPEPLEVSVMLPIETFFVVKDITRHLEALRDKHSTAIQAWGSVNPDNIHDVVNGLRDKLELTHSPRQLIETGSPGGYRLSLPCQNIQLALDESIYGRRNLQF